MFWLRREILIACGPALADTQADLHGVTPSSGACVSPQLSAPRAHPAHDLQVTGAIGYRSILPLAG